MKVVKKQAEVELYKGIFLALRAQGKTKFTRRELFGLRQEIWPTKHYGMNYEGISDTASLTAAINSLGGKEACSHVGPKGKRVGVYFELS